MTNFSLRSALKCACALVLVAGCGPKDGLKELAEAEAAFAVRDLVKADKAAAASLARAPENPDALVLAVQVKLALGQISEADALVKRAFALAGGDADVLLLDAQCAYHGQDYDRAVGDYRKILADASASAELRAQALAGIGAVEMTRNEYVAARVALLQAIRLDRRNAAARYHLGYLYRSSFGYLEAALEQFEIYVRLEKQDAERVRKVQRSMITDLREEIASQAAHRPGAAKRDSAASARALAKAEAFAKPGPKQSWKSARAAYQEAFSADVLSYPAALGLAEATERTDTTPAGRAKALEAYKAACSLRPSSSKTLIKTGELALQLGSPLIAVEAYSRALAANPSDVSAVDGLIRSLRKAGGRAGEAAIYQNYRDSLGRKR